MKLFLWLVYAPILLSNLYFGIVNLFDQDIEKGVFSLGVFAMMLLVLFLREKLKQ